MTIEAWIWSADPRAPTWKPIASRAAAYWPLDTAVPNVNADFNFQVDDYGRLSFFMGNGRTAPWQYGILLLSDNKVRARQWQHVAVTVRAAAVGGKPRDAQLYIDGTLQDTDVWGDGERQWAPHAPLLVGAYDNTDLDRQLWRGFIDELRVWSFAKTAEQLDADMYVHTHTMRGG